MSSETGPITNQDRSARIERVVTEVMDRRNAGESISDEIIAASHPELRPELDRELRIWALVESARLRAHAEPGGSDAGRADEAGWILEEEWPASRGPDERPALRIPGYELLKEIHRGGQGVVYLAMQQSTQREVAVKVIKKGTFAGPLDKARFEREVRLLAQLRHPHIVAIHDSGRVAGHSYFVMDYIAGQSLDASMSEWKRPIEKTLALFLKICQAVNAAHLRGILHRDLKPGNIRVDEQGEPHILDFGLARTAEEQEDSPAVTVTGQFVGSVPWSSPEQAEGIAERIDVRTDVYSLGVLLYQMLTGQFPYEVTGPLRAVLDRIQSAEPIRPRSLRQQINDEVETIVLKCLSKDRERRYQSAGELARDLARYLSGEPIEAKRDSAAYLLRKHWRRHRRAVGVAAAFLVVIGVGLVTSLAGWWRAAAQRDQAVQARLAEAEQRALAEKNENKARQEAAKAQAINTFIQEMLASGDPRTGEHRDPTVRQVLDETAEKIAAGHLSDQPEVLAAVRGTLGGTYLGLGLYDKAGRHLRASLEGFKDLYGDQHLDVAEVLTALASLSYETGDYSTAASLSRDALSIRLSLLGEEHSLVGASLHNLGAVLLSSGDLAGAEGHLRAALALERMRVAPPGRSLTRTLGLLGWLLKEKGDRDGAEALLREALAAALRRYGDENFDVSITQNGLAALLLESGRFAEAEPLFAEALATDRELLGDEDLQVAIVLSNLGSVRRARGDYDGAELLIRHALAVICKKLGEDNPSVATLVNNLGFVLYHKNQYAAAEQLYRQALSMRRQLLGEEHPVVAQNLNNLADVLRAQDRQAEAEPLHWRALELRRRLLPENHPDTVWTLLSLGSTLTELHKLHEAEPMLREALNIRTQVFAADDWRVGEARSALGACLAEQRRFEEAETLLLDAYEQVKDHAEESRDAPPETIRRVVRLYEAWGKGDLAAEWRARAATEHQP